MTRFKHKLKIYPSQLHNKCTCKLLFLILCTYFFYNERWQLTTKFDILKNMLGKKAAFKCAWH